MQSREDVFGLDGSLISSAKIWEASGHLASFSDMLVQCVKCGKSHRADSLVEDTLKINVDGIKADALNKLIADNNIKCPECKSDLKPVESFNLMFPVQIGAEKTKDSTAYLRGETAQLIFAAFRNIVDSSRVKLPFGIAQVGKAFRNEISPRNFLFRTREFEQMELEFFIKPDDRKCLLLEKKHLDLAFFFYSAEDQEKKKEHSQTKISDMLKKKKLDEWHAYWLAESYLWFTGLGMKEENLRVREHTKTELSHYSSATFDIDYNFPFGWKEIYGNANRGQFDLAQHMKHSGKSLEIFDEDEKGRIVPRVIEPSFGVDRAFMSFLYDAYNDDTERGNIVLKLHPKLAPIKVGVFPLINKLDKDARKVYDMLKDEFACTYDRGGSIGRRYARADEQGIPFCITIDFETLEDKAVTIRDRDNTKQERIKISKLKDKLGELLNQ